MPTINKQQLHYFNETYSVIFNAYISMSLNDRDPKEKSKLFMRF